MVSFLIPAICASLRPVPVLPVNVTMSTLWLPTSTSPISLGRPVTTLIISGGTPLSRRILSRRNADRGAFSVGLMMVLLPAPNDGATLTVT